MRWIVVLAVFLVAQGVGADLAGVTYLNPDLWPVQSKDGVDTLVAPGSTAQEFLLVSLSSARAATGHPDQALAAFADHLDGAAKRLSREPVQSSGGGSLQVWLMTEEVDAAPLGKHRRLYQLVTDGQADIFAVVLFRGEKTFSSQSATLRAILTSVRPLPAPASSPSPEGGIPYGTAIKNLLDNDFLPRGKGVPIPPSAVKNQTPVGLWWHLHRPDATNPSLSVSTALFGEDGTKVSLFRPGGPLLADLEAMRQGGEAGYLYRYSMRDGVLSADNGQGDQVSGAVRWVGPPSQPAFVWRNDEYHRALPVERKDLVGTWKLGAKGQFTFQADGQVVTTPAMINAGWSHQGKPDDLIVGTWVVEGYLLALRFPHDGTRVWPLFSDRKDQIVLQQELYFRP